VAETAPGAVLAGRRIGGGRHNITWFKPSVRVVPICPTPAERRTDSTAHADRPGYELVTLLTKLKNGTGSAPCGHATRRPRWMTAADIQYIYQFLSRVW
jgi:hypothetical protein